MVDIIKDRYEVITIQLKRGRPKIDPRGTAQRVMYVLEWRTISALTRGLFWCLFPELRSNEGNKYQNNTRVSTETVRHESKYIILFLTRHNESINDKNDDLYTSSPCLTRSVFVLQMTSQSIADDVIVTGQLWRDHVKSDIYLVRHRFYSQPYSRPVVLENIFSHRTIRHKLFTILLCNRTTSVQFFWYHNHTSFSITFHDNLYQKPLKI